VGLLVLAGLAGGITFYFEPIWVNDEVIRLHLRGQNVQSEYVDVDGYKIHYFEAVPPARLRVLGDGPPLVLVHGLGSRGEDWSGMIPTLAAHGFHVYVPDLLGYGRSSKPDVDYSISLEEKTIVDFMKAVHLDRADVGGWSMGGWVALKLTVDHPEMVRRLMVYDSAGIYFPPTFDAAFFTPTDSIGVARLSAKLSPHPKPLPGFVSDAAIRRLQTNAWVIQRSVSAMESGKDLMDFRLHKIERPTLIVWGSEDKLIPPSVGETMHEKVAGSSMMIVEGCGHLAPGECAKPVLAGTLKFLEAVPPLKGWEATVAGDGK
jgi:pimeloyl-ACP methyl ester carboxylesterase